MSSPIAPTPSLTGADVRAIRDRLGLSQSDLAAVLGLSRGSYVSDIERGTQPVTATLARLLSYVDRHGLPVPGAAAAPGLAAHAAALRSIAAQLEAAADAGATGSADDAAPLLPAR